MIATGAQGVVYKGRMKNNNQVVAVKRVSGGLLSFRVWFSLILHLQLHIRSMDTIDISRFCAEIKITSLLEHENICRFYGNFWIADVLTCLVSL